MKVTILPLLFYFFPLISFAQEVNEEEAAQYLEEDKKKNNITPNAMS